MQQRRSSLDETHPLTLRAALIGLLAVAFLTVAASYCDLYLQNSELSGNHLPLGPVLVMLLLIAVVNGALRSVRGPLRLTPSELLFIFCMTLVGAGIPTFGLSGYLLPAITAPTYFASPENGYDAVFPQHLPAWLTVRNHDAVRYFYEGLRGHARIPWGDWVGPLAIWSAFVVLLYTLMICLSSLVAPRWIREEKLTFPLVQVPMEMVQSQEERAWWRSPLLWIGIAIPAVLHTFSALHYYFPSVPELRLKMLPFGSATVGRPWNQMNGLVYVYFSVIGLSFLLPTDVSFSIWFFYFVNKFQFVVADAMGAIDPYTRVAESQYVGGFALFALFALRISCKPGRLSLQAFKSFLADAECGDQMMSRRAAATGLCCSLLLLLGFCGLMGISIPFATLMFAIFMLICVGLSRIVAESGVLFAKATQMMPLKILLPVLGGGTLGAANITGIGLLQYIFMFDLKAFLMPALMNSHKVSAEARLNKRHLLWAIAASLAVAIVVSYVAILTIAYRHGALQMHPWYFIQGPQGNCSNIVSSIKNPTPVDSGKIVAMVAGALVVVFLHLMRTRFLWWPFHPVGYVLAYSYETTRVWFPFLVGWACKVVILRYWGLRGYRQARDFFFGLILGEFGIAGLWLVIDTILHKSGHMVFP